MKFILKVCMDVSTYIKSWILKNKRVSLFLIFEYPSNTFRQVDYFDNL